MTTKAQMVMSSRPPKFSSRTVRRCQLTGRARGVYTMLNGTIQGGNSDAIYIVDSANQEMVVVRWNDGRSALEGIGFRNLNADAQAQPGR